MTNESVMKTSEEREELDIFSLLSDLLHRMRRLWWVVLLTTVICGVLFYQRSSVSYVPTYVAEATVSVEVRNGERYADRIAAENFDLKDEMEITMHNDPTVLEFDGKRFLVGHGDGLGHQDKRYDCLRRIFRSRLNQRLFSILPEWMTFGLATGWSSSSRKSHIKKNPDIFKYQGDDREGIVIYCRERMAKEHFDYCVFGHRHTPLVREITADNGTKSTYVNVGDWLMNRNYAVYSDGTMTLFS